MLSLGELQRAARLAAALLEGARLKRIDQPEPCALVFTFDPGSGKASGRFPLLVSCRPGYARICLAQQPVAQASDAPSSSFHQRLRANWAGSRLRGIGAADGDRSVTLSLESREGACKVVFSIMGAGGARSNIYLLDGAGRLLHALRPLGETRKELAVGEAWMPPQGGAPSAGGDRWATTPDAEYLREVARHYRAAERRGDAEDLARRILQALKKEHAFLDRKRLNLQEDLGRARQAETDRRRGELLKNVLHLVKPGDGEVEAVDYASGERVAIPLDARLSPVENLESYFARYQKEQRGERRILEQLRDVDASRLALDALREKTEAALGLEPPDLGALGEVAASPAVRRSLRQPPPAQKPPSAPGGASPARAAHVAGGAGKKDLPAKLRPKRYRTEEGLEVWVGRNDEGNDYLTTRLARGNDLFLHLEGYPGSHVILRTEGRADPSPKALVDACELAVHYSKMKNAGSADVHVAPVKDVKKPKGAKPGLVYVRGGRSVRLKRDPKRLERLLASRLDD
ncbi:MAG: NFACT RNA binding domain-containing protein [Acidobacteriota bacterium]|jgi:predicted ribosome quality control (RQC) complex YloA/Tae2 family protein|nr:NFACT RNA binding domain-containing protein [Acidobacteriota bacterium]